VLLRSHGEPVRDQHVIVRQSAKGSYWCWPLPPDGPVTISIAWPAADIDEVIGTFSGESLRN
jgi:hypothetical protein